MSRLARAAGSVASGAAAYYRPRGVHMSSPMPPPRPLPHPGPPLPPAPYVADPTGLRYDRADTEPDAKPVPDGVELWRLGDRDLDVRPPTLVELDLADDPVVQLVQAIDRLSSDDRAAVLAYCWPEVVMAPPERLSCVDGRWEVTR